MHLAPILTGGPPAEAHRRPSGLDLTAAVLLVATVVLHVVAMAPSYFIDGSPDQSLMSQPDQATLYAILAAAWALALAVGMTGPSRTPIAAGLAVGIAAPELGFRVADLGDVFRYGTATAGAGLWLMEAAWVVGAAAAVVAVLAARTRHGTIGLRPRTPAERTAPVGAAEPARSVWDIDWAAPAEPGVASTSRFEPPAPVADPYLAEPPVAEAPVEEPPSTLEPVAPAWSSSGSVGPAPAAAPTVSMDTPTATTGVVQTSPRRGDTGVMPAMGQDEHSGGERTAWTMLVVVLALVVGGAFLPAWDHYTAVSTVTGRSISRNLGDAFSNAWQITVGTVLAAAALVIVPIVAVRLHRRAVGAALACGSLLVLATQLASAIVSVDQPVQPQLLGLSPNQASQLGAQLSLRLTGWFTLDAIAAYALLAVILVWATLRVVHDDSGEPRPSAPDWRNDATAWGP